MNIRPIAWEGPDAAAIPRGRAFFGNRTITRGLGVVLSVSSIAWKRSASSASRKVEAASENKAIVWGSGERILVFWGTTLSADNTTARERKTMFLNCRKTILSVGDTTVRESKKITLARSVKILSTGNTIARESKDVALACWLAILSTGNTVAW